MKRKVQAQRKFAQGAYIPPHNNNVTVDRRPEVIPGKEPKNVIHNSMSPKELLDIVSLRTLFIRVDRLEGQVATNFVQPKPFLEEKITVATPEEKPLIKKVKSTKTRGGRIVKPNKKLISELAKGLRREKKITLSKKNSMRLRSQTRSTNDQRVKLQMRKRKISTDIRLLNTENRRRLKNRLSSVSDFNIDDDKPLKYFAKSDTPSVKKRRTQQVTAEVHPFPGTSGVNKHNSKEKVITKPEDSNDTKIEKTKPSTTKETRYYTNNGIDRWIDNSDKKKSAKSATATDDATFKVPALPKSSEKRTKEPENESKHHSVNSEKSEITEIPGTTEKSESPKKSDKVDTSDSNSAVPITSTQIVRTACPSAKFFTVKEVIRASNSQLESRCGKCTQCLSVNKAMYFSKFWDRRYWSDAVTSRKDRRTTRQSAVSSDGNEHLYLDLLPENIPRIIQITVPKVPRQAADALTTGTCIMSARLVPRSMAQVTGDIKLVQTDILDQLIKVLSMGQCQVNLSKTPTPKLKNKVNTRAKPLASINKKKQPLNKGITAEITQKPSTESKITKKSINKDSDVGKSIESTLKGRTSKEPTLQELALKESSSKEPTPKEPTLKVSKSKEPISKEFKSKEPTSKEFKSKEPTSKEFKSKEPTSKEFKSKEPTSKEFKSKEPTSKEFKSKEPTSKELKSKEPTSKEFKSKELTAKEPTLNESKSKEPTPKEPMLTEPTVKESKPKESMSKEPINITKISNEPSAKENSRNKRSEDGDKLSPNLVDAPIFYPTEVEFLDPLSYIESIMPTAAKFGLCKIVPPKKFKPECNLNDKIRFNVTNQYIARLYCRWGSAAREMCAIKAYLASQSVQFSRSPLLEGLEVNLPKLYHLVQRHGGLKRVIEKKRWGRVAEEMRLDKGPRYEKKLDQLYVKYLLPYDTLSNQERQQLMVSVEKRWNKKNARLLERALNPLHRQKRLLGESESSDDETEEEDDVVHALAEAEDCVVSGRNMNLVTFKRVAKTAMDTLFPGPTPPTVAEVEREYWRLVLLATDHVCVNTASIDTGEEGYGFTKNRDEEYGTHPWNLKMMSHNSANMLRFLGPVLGVTVPTLHLGMVFSTSCWHRDPHGLPWIEYMHSGPGKIWYGIPDEHSGKFRKAIEALCPTSCQNKSIWLPSDITMIPPNLLHEHNVLMSRVVQNPGEFIVVFPKAYSCSISAGYTETESVYFATNSWLKSVHQVFQETQQSCEPTMFSLEHLLIQATKASQVPLAVLQQVHSSLNTLVNDELNYRRQLVVLGLQIRTVEHMPETRAWSARDQEECEICRSTLYLSRVTGLTGRRSSVCLLHALRLLEIQKNAVNDRTCLELITAFPTEELELILTTLQARLF